MRQLRNTLISICLAASMILPPACLPPADVQAADTAINETQSDKVSDDAEKTVYTVSSGSDHYTNWPSTMRAYLVPLEDGKLMSINFAQYKDQETGKTKNAMLAGYYYPDSENGGYKFNEEASKTIGLEFPVFGGFHATDKYYFVLTAQNNKEHSNSKDIFRITRFDKDWNHLGSVELKNCNTAQPFAFGSARMATCGDYLLIRTCHNMYNGHQSNLTLQLNMETMQLAFSKPGYTSHSLNQFVKVDEDNHMVTVDIGDYYSRGVILNTYNGDVSKGIYGGSKETCALKFKGSGVYTHATAGGFELSGSSYLIAGSSIDQDPKSTSDVKNIFLAAVNKETKESEVKWLTKEDKISVRTPYLVKMDNDQFLMLWQKGDGKDNIIYCSKVDGAGNPISSGNSAEGNGNGTENGAAGNGEAGTGSAGEGDAGNTENKPVLPTDYEIVELPGKLTGCAPVVSGSSLVWTDAAAGENGTDLSLYEIKTKELKGNDTVSTSAIHVTKTEKPVKYPVSTVETIVDSSNNDTDDMPGDADSGVSSGSSGSTGSWGSGAVSTNQPFIQDSSGRYGWDAIIAELTKTAAAQDGQTVTVNMNGVYQVPRRVFEGIRGKNVTLVLYIGPGIQWRVYGKDITAETVSDINLYVRTGTGNIPQDAVNHVADGLEYLKLSLTQNGAFGFPLTMSVRLAKSNGALAIKSVNPDGIRMLAAANGTADTYAGMYANLFSYHSGHELEFASAGKIGENGMADLAVARGGDYVLIVSPKQMGGTEPPQNDNTAAIQPEPPQQPEETVQPEVKSVKLSKTVYTYTGKEKKPSVTATDTNGQKISSKDYTVSYKNNKKVGEATAIVKFKNNYSGTVKKTFTIRPAGTSIKKTAAVSKGFTVKWKKKNAQTSGYQIQYSTNAGFKTGSSSKVLVKKASVNKKTIKNLKAAKKYYVRIRTYKTVNIDGKNTKIYSKWSASEKVKTLSAAAKK